MAQYLDTFFCPKNRHIWHMTARYCRAADSRRSQLGQPFVRAMAQMEHFSVFGSGFSGQKECFHCVKSH